jgi:hypothetical protein
MFTVSKAWKTLAIQSVTVAHDINPKLNWWCKAPPI